MVLLFEGLLAAELGIIWKERDPFGIRQCLRILANADFREMYMWFEV